MHLLDISIYILYLLGMLGVGIFFMQRNKSTDDYFVGGRNMTSKHIGLSVVATDVGGGFSIGLGGFISAISYLGFTSSQLLAGAKLASSTFNGLSPDQALLLMGLIAILYTSLGGMKAVIYTDTIQWIILLTGLSFIALPYALKSVGGWNVVVEILGKEFISLRNVSWQQLVNWAFTIIPIWFVGMTLYQHIYASRDEKSARRAWFIAGVFEYR